MAVLKMLTGPMTGDLLSLLPEGVLIGRGESNQLRIIEASVSSRHARIWQEQGHWWLQDLGSTNGTLINNAEAPVNSPVPLTSGDKLAFGHVVATFDAFMELTPLAQEPVPQEPLVEVAPPPDPLAEANARIEALQAALTAAQQQLVHAQSTDMVSRAEVEAGFAAERDAFRRQLREMEQKLVEQAAEVEAFQRSLAEQGVQGGLPSKEREALEASERERATLEQALSQATEREQALQAQLDTLHKELRDISGVRRVAVADAEEEQKRADTLEQQIVVLERAVADAKQDGDVARQEAARIDELTAELEAARAQADDLTSRLADAEAVGHELRRELDRQQQATAAQEADLAAVRQQGVQLRERILVLEQQLLEVEGRATDALDDLRAQWQAASDRSETLASELDQARAAAEVLEAKLAPLEAQLAEKTSVIAALEARLTEGDDGASAAVEAAKAEAAALGEKLSIVEAEVAARADRIATLEAQLSAGDEGAKAALEAARQEATVLADKLAALEAQLAAGDEQARSAVESADHAAQEWRARFAALEDQLAAERERAHVEKDALQQRLADLETQSAAWQEARAQAQAQVAVLEERLAATQSAPVVTSGDRSEVEYLRARAAMLRGLFETGVETVNNEISRVRRNAEIFRGYLDDVDHVASFVMSLDPSGLNPPQQTQWQALIDEVGPSEVVAQLRSMADENAEAASSTKGLVLELKNVVSEAQPGADLEQALRTGQGFLPQASLPVEVSGLLPALACEPSEAVLFGFALAQEAGEFGEGSPAVSLSPEGDALRLELSPLSGRVRARWTETADGGGDDRSRFLHGFVTRTCGGEVSVEDAADGCRLALVFYATRPA